MNEMNNNPVQRKNNTTTIIVILFSVVALVLALFTGVLLTKFISINRAPEMTTEPETELSEELQDVDEPEKATLFSNGLLSVLKDGKWGYINEAGTLVIDYQFEYAYEFNDDGYAVVSVDDRFGLIDKNGKYIINPQYGLLSSDSSDGLRLVGNDGKFGYLDKKGNIVIDFIFDGAFDFRNGYAIVCLGSVYGIIDTKGQYVVNPQYDELNYAYSEKSGKNLFVAEKDSKTGYIDEKGNTVIDFIFDYIVWYDDTAEFLEDKYAVVEVNGKRGAVDTKGNYIIEPKYEDLFYYGNDLFVFTDGNTDKKGFINAEGVETVSAQFDAVLANGVELIPAAIGDYWGFVDSTGKYVINPVFEYTYGFINGFAVVGKDDKYTFIDETGKAVTDYQFDYMSYFNTKGCAIVEVNGRYGIINTQGEYVVECKYPYMSDQLHPAEASALKEDFFFVIDESKVMKIISTDGKVIAQGFDGVGLSEWIVCEEPGCYEFVWDGDSYCYNHNVTYTPPPAHVVSYNYNTNFTAYLRNPSGKTRVYTSCGVMASDHWISGPEPVTIHEVYTDGCCRVSYITDSGTVRTYYAKISDFVTAHIINYNYGREFYAYVRNPHGKTKVYTSCGVMASDHWISGYEPVRIHEVYTDGCCKVSYITDSGIVRTYYAKTSDFQMTTPN